MYKCDGVWFDEDEEGNEIEVEIPMIWEICGECRGEGKSLCDGMRGHAYSMEEFQETFSDEEQHGYFNGMYDTKCGNCNGNGKVKVEDYSVLSDDQKKDMNDWYQSEEEDARTHRMEMGYY